MQHNGEPRYVMQTTVPFTKPDGTVTVGLARVPLPEMLQPPPGRHGLTANHRRECNFRLLLPPRLSYAHAC